MFKNEEGFSLLELVVAVAVAGIIAAVALPSFTGITAAANNSADAYQSTIDANAATENGVLGL